MSDFRKVFCVYHPEEFITNFCKDKNCLMPLCPSCIGSHNDYHDKSGFRANYLNIFDSLAEVQTLIYDSLVNLEQDKKRNDQVIYHIHNLPMLIHEKVVMAKNMAYNALEKAFEELQKQILYTMDKRHEEAGVFSLSRAEKHQSHLIEGIADLYEMTQNLKNERCLSSMIKYYCESQAELTALHNQITAALYVLNKLKQVNENYVPSIEVNDDAITSMTALLGRFVHVNFSFPTQIEPYSRDIKQTGSVIRKSAPIPPAVVQRAAPIMKSTISQPPLGSHHTPSPAVHHQPPILTATNSSIHQSNLRSKTPPRSFGQPSTSPKKYNYLGGINYDEQFETLSRKVKEMRKQNEMLSKALKNF